MKLIDSPLLASLGEERQGLLEAECRRRTYRRGETIFHAGDPADSLHVVCEGLIAVRFRDERGRDATLGYRTPGEALGVLALLAGDADSERIATASAVTDTTTLVLPATRFRSLCSAHPDLNTFLVGALARRIRYLEDRLGEALLMEAEGRVIRRLISLFDRLDVGQDGAVTITQDDLASLAGTTRPTVNRALRAAERGGFLRLGRGRIVVLDADGLAKHFSIGR